MHRLPQRTRLNICLLHGKAKILTTEPRFGRINQNGSEPMIGIEIIRRILQKRNPRNILQQLTIERIDLAPALHKSIQRLQLTPTNTRTNIAQTVVVANFRVLIVWRIIARLSRIKHRTPLLLSRGAHQSTPARSGHNLIAIKRQTSKLAKRATFPPLIFRPQSLGSILQHRNLKLGSNRQNLIHLRRHSIQMHRNYSLRQLPSHPQSILHSQSQMHGTHIPRLLLAIHKHRLSPQILNRIGTSRKGKRLTNHLVAPCHSQLHQL